MNHPITAKTPPYTMRSCSTMMTSLRIPALFIGVLMAISAVLPLWHHSAPGDSVSCSDTLQAFKIPCAIAFAPTLSARKSSVLPDSGCCLPTRCPDNFPFTSTTSCCCDPPFGPTDNPKLIPAPPLRSVRYHQTLITLLPDMLSIPSLSSIPGFFQKQLIPSSPLMAIATIVLIV